MIEFYNTVSGNLSKTEKPEKGCWISVQQPTQSDIDYLVKDIGINPNYIETSLDENERSHIEVKDNQTLIIFDTPLETAAPSGGIPQFDTVPVGFILANDYVVSIMGIPTPLIKEITTEKLQHNNTANSLKFILSIIYNISCSFISYLNRIEKLAFNLETNLQKKLKNADLVQLLSLQKSLVYFTTSLKSGESTLEKVSRGRIVSLDEEETDLTDDSLIEIRQSIETASVFSEVLSSTVDAVGSILSNNMNIVMKVLTSITLVLSIPNMVFGFYGMNVYLSEQPIHFFIPVMITLLITGLCTWILYINDFF